MGRESPLRVLFPRLCRLLVSHSAHISNFLVWEDSTFSWNFHFFRNLNDRDAQDFIPLLDQLHLFHPSDQVDRRFWILDPSGLFLVKSFMKILNLYSNTS